MQKSYKIFKPRLLNVLNTETNIVKIWLSLYLLGCVRFARHCGKMHNRHLFSYSGFQLPFGQAALKFCPPWASLSLPFSVFS